MARTGVLRVSVVCAAVLVAILLVLAVAGLAKGASSSLSAPGSPGDPAKWTEADKDGFGTTATPPNSTTIPSKVWYTLNNGELTEVYYPDLGTPSVRDLQFIVSDGKTFADLETTATTHRVQLVDNRALEYRQVDTDIDGKYRLTKTYVTDPDRSTVLVDVNFESLSGKPYQLYVLFDPSLNNGGMNDSATSQNGQLLANDDKVASALVAAPEFGQVSSGYLGTSDGWTDLKDDKKMDWNYRSANSGNVVQTARTSINGLPDNQHLTLSLGFASSTSNALQGAQASLGSGFQQVQGTYESGWDSYLNSLKSRPASADSSALLQTTYNVSVMSLAAHEDKTHRGAYIASPSMPWVWGDPSKIENPSGAYHLVWSRDLYQIATALLAAGDKAGAERALTYLFEKQQNADGSFPQNSTIDGTDHWTNIQLDEVALPIVLAWQLGRKDGQIYEDVKQSADYIMAHGPVTQQERWENQGGYSPATIAAEIAGLVCAADIAQANGKSDVAAAYRAKADEWQQNVEGWTVTTNGPLAEPPYYLRITKDGNPDAATTYNVGDSGPSAADQRTVVDTSYLELVRLGVKPADNPTIVHSLAVVDNQLGVTTPNGTFWHRYNYDGYGEQRDGSPWDFGFDACGISECTQPQATIGRIWPIFAGERGEYELAAGKTGAAGRLASMAKAGNDGYMLPEQVWDDNPPSCTDTSCGYPQGEGTFSATPLAWTHAQFVRLAWSIQEGKPVERPSIVYDRYVGSTSQAGG
jgi:glucoamylase